MDLLLLNCYPDPAVLLDGEGKILYLNPAARGLQQRLGGELKISPGQTHARYDVPGLPEPAAFTLHWSRVQWEGFPAWMAYARRETAVEAPRGRVEELPSTPAPRQRLLELELQLARQMVADGLVGVEPSAAWVEAMEKALGDDPAGGVRQAERSLKLSSLATYYQGRVRQLERWRAETQPLLADLRARLALAEQASSSRDTKRLAYQDPVAGTPNANLLMPYLEQVVESVRAEQTSACVLLLEVQGLAALTETLGREASHEVVREVADRVRAQLRPDDVLGRTYGGELLAIASLPVGGAAGQAAAQQLVGSLAQKMVNALQAPFTAEGQAVEARVLIGGVVPTPAVDLGEVLAQARTAREQARRSTAGYHLFGTDLERRRSKEQALLGQLRAALDEEQFTLRYQPVIDMASGRMMGAEALLRWNHPTQGQLEPSTFLELADNAGLLMAVGEWVVREACAEIVALSGSLVCMVNVSERQVVQADLARRLMKAWERTKLRAENLVVEVPEPILALDPDRSEKFGRELARCKVNLAIDNFGADFASLRRLKRMGTVFVKLEPGLVRHLPRQDENYHLCRSLIAAATGMQMFPVAKAVETAQQAACLKTMGCRFAQGKLFAGPLTATQLRDVLKKTWKV